MEEQAFDSAELKVVQRARNVFHHSGYGKVTMTALADACGLTRRGLYHHFKSKEEVFRASMRLGNMEAFQAAEWAAQNFLARGGSALDVIAEWLDTRFGNTRRSIARTPHGGELNDIAFRIGSDIMIEISRESHARLEALIAELCRRGLLALRPEFAAAETASLIADGARGVNQERPPIPPSLIAQRYRRIAEAVLYGCAQAAP